MNASTPAASLLPSASLHCQENGSDKEYHAQVVEENDGYVVKFQYGRRGRTLTPGCKTPVPVSFDKAVKVFQKLVAEKTAKGYRESGASASVIEQVERCDSGLRPQLLNAIERDRALPLLDSADWCLQEKFDGKRIMLAVDVMAGTVAANNKLGWLCPVPQALINDALRLPVRTAIFDGELIGEVYHVFDILALNGRDMRHCMYATRYHTYASVLASQNLPAMNSFTVVLSAFTPADKTAAYRRIEQAGGEGVVFKRLDAQAVPGRPNSAGDQLKCKFTDTASIIVGSVSDTKRSIGMFMLRDGGEMVSVGNCTIPPNCAIPSVGSVAEVRYLYRCGAAGSLFQPVFLGERDDIAREECLASQVTRIKA